MSIQSPSESAPHPPYWDHLYQLLVRNLPNMAVIVFDKDLRYITAEGAFLASAGFSPELILGKTLQDVLPPAAYETLAPMYRAALAGETIELERAVGEYIYYARILPVRDERGEICAGMIVAQDITAQSHAELALKESEERYRLLVENSFDAVILGQPDGSILAANPIACQMFGCTEAELKALNRNDLLDSADPRVAALVAAREQNGEVFGEVTAIRRDGSRFPLEITSRIFTSSDGQVKTSNILRDVTERKRAEAELRAGQHLIQEIMNTVPDILHIYDLVEQRTVYTNERLTELTGYSKEQFEALGASALESVTHPDSLEKLREMIRQYTTLADGEITDFEIQVQHADGSWRWFRNRSRIFSREGDGVPRQVLSIVTDTTEQREAAQRAAELAAERQRVQILREFLRDSSHDLRTPLSILVLVVERLLALDPAPALVGEYQKIQSQLDRLTTALDKMLVLGVVYEVESTFRDVIVFNTIIQEQFERLADQLAERQITLFQELADDLPVIHGDPLEFANAILCIAENAVQFTPANGVITVRSYQRAPHVVIEVADTGTGIEPEHLPHIFKSFYKAARTRSVGGPGLGLSIAQSIVMRMDGRIEVESEPGLGSLFRILIPFNL